MPNRDQMMTESPLPVSQQPGEKSLRSNIAMGIGLLAIAGIAVGGFWLTGVRANQEEKNAAKQETDAPSKAADAKKKPEAKEGDVEYPRPHRLPLPPDILEGGTDWLNTSGPIELADLRGKIVLIDFWTYCCINCIHVLPDLKYLEKKYPNELVVIGCHSAKFDNEKESENIRRAIMRYEIEHPVINDSEMKVWRRIGVRSWPSLLVIDAESQACLMVSGEGHRDYLDDLIAKLIKYHKAKGTLDEQPFRFDLERHKAKNTPLRFPGKVLADESGNRLFISDSNHNRIVITDLNGKLLDTIGSGAIGAKDGDWNTAEFDHPQGMALVGDQLYVADTENHLLRTVDLTKKTVSTLAGTGEQARRRFFNWKLKETALNSPWDVLHVDGTLYVAMAGPHQIWSHKIGSDKIEVYAGTGQEDILDGPLAESALAQPSGLATDGKFLYVCDSEGSSIRKIGLGDNAEVGTIVGTSDLPRGRCLFEFGDIDGVGDKARLQHPLGIAHIDGKLFVADSYNHKIKEVNLAKSEATTWLGLGKAGAKLEPAPQFSEPSGLSIAGGTLFIADTNNHRILKADIKTKAVAELAIAGLKPPTPPKQETDLADGAKAVEVAAQEVKSGKTVAFEVTLDIPKGFKVNALFPVSGKVKGDAGLFAGDALGKRQKGTVKDKTVTFTLPLEKQAGEGTFDVSLTYGYCREGKGGFCKIATAKWKLPLTVSDNADAKAVKLTAAKP